MAFSNQAIGFYLELEDRLTPVLKKAERGYAKYVSAINQHNKSAFRSSSGAMGELSRLVKSFEKLPQKAERGYRDALKKIKRQSKKAIEQPLNLVLTSKAKKSLQKAIGEAVVKAMSGAKMRLRASMPQRKLSMFSKDQTLRTAYRNIAQPPDMLGWVKPKKFAKGGIVEGGTTGKDSVPALLQPGEMVLPVKLVEFWNKTTEKATKGVAFISNKFKGFGKRVEIVNEEAITFDKNIGRWRNSLGQFIKVAPDGIRKVEDAIDDANAGAVGWMVTIGGVAQGIKDMGDNVTSAFSEAEGGEAKGFLETMNGLNQHLGLSRKELQGLKSAAVDSAAAGGAGLNEMAMAMEALVEAGVTNREELLRLAPVVANTATATNADIGSIAKASYALGDGYKYSADQIAQMLLATTSTAHATAATGATLMEQMNQNIEDMSPLLGRVSKESGAAILTNLGTITGSLTDQWGAAGTAIADTMAKAIGSNDKEAIKSLGKMGIEFDGLQEKLASGNMVGVFDDMANSINQLRGSGGLNELKESMGFEESIQAFSSIGAKIDDINTSLGATGKQTMADLVDPNAAEKQAQGANNMKTTYDRMSESFTTAISQFEKFGIRGDEVIDFFSEFNPISVVATVNMIRMAGVGMGGLLMKLPLLGKGLAGLGGKMKGIFGKKSPLADPKGPLSAGSGSGGAIKSMLKGVGAGLKFLGKGLSAFGKAMIGPGGLGLIALTAALIGIGFAIKLAAPLFKMLGKVISKAIDGFVEMFKTIATLDPKQMLGLGPALILTAGGVIALAGATAILGISMLGAAVGVGAFRLATGGKGLASGGLASVISDLVGGFQPLTKQARHLDEVNRVMETLVGFMLNFSKLALIIGGLSIGATIAGAVNSVLGFFGFDSPMEQLAKQGSQMADTLTSLVTDFAGLAGILPQMDLVSSTMSGMLNFLKKYAALAGTLSELPAQGVFSNIADSIGNFFGSDSPIEKLAEDAAPVLKTLAKLTTQFSDVQLAAGAAASVFTGTQAGGLSQSGAKVAVNDKQIQSVVTAVLERADESPLHGDLQENNRLLGEIVSLLRGGSPTPAPLMVQGPRQTRSSHPFIEQISRGGF
jgi:hypothetical protein